MICTRPKQNILSIYYKTVAATIAAAVLALGSLISGATYAQESQAQTFEDPYLQYYQQYNDADSAYDYPSGGYNYGYVDPYNQQNDTLNSGAQTVDELYDPMYDAF